MKAGDLVKQIWPPDTLSLGIIIEIRPSAPVGDACVLVRWNEPHRGVQLHTAAHLEVITRND